MFRIGPLSVAVVALVLLLAACGGDDEPDDPGGSSEDTFVEDADSICTEGASEIEEILAETSPVVDAESAAAQIEQLIPAVEQTNSLLANLDPPEDVADAWQAFRDSRAEQVEIMNQELEAAQNNENDLTLAIERREIRAEGDEAAAEAGLEACARILPADQVEDVTAAMEDQGANSDPAHCTEDFTDAFVEQIGGIEACEKAEADTSDDPDSLEFVGEVVGVESVTASSQVKPVGGPNDGALLCVYLVYEDESWKTDFVQQATEGTPC